MAIGVAATAQRLGNQLAVRLAGTRARRAPGGTPVGGHSSKWPVWRRSRWTPPAWWPVLTARGRWTPPAWWPVLAATPAVGRRARAPGSRPPSDRRSPSRDGRGGLLRCAAATSPVAPAPELAAVCCRPRRCSCRRRNMRFLAGVNVSARYVVVAGFQVSISGRFWVSTEVATFAGGRAVKKPDSTQVPESGRRPWGQERINSPGPNWW